MVWSIIKIYTSKCAQMDPQRLLKTSKFHSKSKKFDIEKPLGGAYHLPLGSPKAKLFRLLGFLMYAQSHALHWTQEYDKEEGLYTKINALLCLTFRLPRGWVPPPLYGFFDITLFASGIKF